MSEAAHSLITASLKRILEQRETLSRAESAALLNQILDVDDFGSELRISALLGALAARGETEYELAGFVDALRARVTPLPLSLAEQALLVDTCGTGGDLSGTFNISTAAALVACAAGASVAKHGNRAVTSRCGSADVLEALGIPVDLSPALAAASLRTHRFAFLPAPALQPAMKSVMPIRRALGVRTAFNILGPMTNPAGARAQVLGVYSKRLVAVVANTMKHLDTRHAFIVHGETDTADNQNPDNKNGMDEFSISGPTHLAEVRNGEATFRTVLPEAFGLKLSLNLHLQGGDAETNAQILRAIFAGELSPRRDVVLMNAAAVLVTAGLDDTFAQATQHAQSVIASGAVTALVAALAHPQAR